MTKKDYIKIAEQFKSAQHLASISDGRQYISPFIGAMILDFADMLAQDNPKFNRNTFINYINK